MAWARMGSATSDAASVEADLLALKTEGLIVPEGDEGVRRGFLDAQDALVWQCRQSKKRLESFGAAWRNARAKGEAKVILLVPNLQLKREVLVDLMDLSVNASNRRVLGGICASMTILKLLTE